MWISLPVLTAGAVAAIMVLIPEPAQPNLNPSKNAPPAKVRAPISTQVSAVERRGINATLDKFLSAGLNHNSMATAWRLAGPELKGGTTLREWERGTSPIPYYPTHETAFHGWTTIDAGPNYVVFNILVHPRRGATSSWVFSGEVIKHRSGWVVNRLYTVATMQRPTKQGQKEVGPADFQAGPAAAGIPVSKGALSTTWLLAIVGIIGMVLVFPLGFGIAVAVKGRRRRREYEGSRSRSLPPLPNRPQHTAGEPRT